jgi:hypothetical protein
MKKLLILAGVMILATAVNGATIIVDDFTSTNGLDYEFNQTAAGTETREKIYVETDLTGVLGGIRTTTLTCSPHTYNLGGGPYDKNGGFNALIDPGNYMGLNGLLKSDGDRLNGEGSISLAYEFGAMDASVGSFSARLMTDHFDYIKSTVISLTLSDGASSETVVFDHRGMEAHLFFDVTFNMSDFSTLNPESITGLKFTYESDIANDLSIDSLTASTVTFVPEPLTLGLLALGSLAFRRRKKI